MQEKNTHILFWAPRILFAKFPETFTADWEWEWEWHIYFACKRESQNPAGTTNRMLMSQRKWTSLRALPSHLSVSQAVRQLASLSVNQLVSVSVGRLASRRELTGQEKVDQTVCQSVSQSIEQSIIWNDSNVGLSQRHQAKTGGVCPTKDILHAKKGPWLFGL